MIVLGFLHTLPTAGLSLGKWLVRRAKSSTCLCVCLHSAQLSEHQSVWPVLTGRRDSGVWWCWWISREDEDRPKGPPRLASPGALGPERKWKKTQLIHSRSHWVNQSPPAGQVTHIHTNTEHAVDTYICAHTHLKQTCPHYSESIFGWGGAARRRRAISHTCTAVCLRVTSQIDCFQSHRNVEAVN